MRIAIAHHSPQIREILRRIVTSVPGYRAIWMASTGTEAVSRCLADPPDLLLVDLSMPNLDGVQAICMIMRQSPCAILVVTTSVADQTGKIFEAMGCGALDAVRMPYSDASDTLSGTDDLLKKIAVIGKLQGKTAPLARIAAPALQPRSGHLPPLVAIGSSTGGPKALAAILSALPANLGAAMIIVQHLDVQFASGLADWLDDQTPLTVKLVGERMEPAIDTVLVAGTNDHLILGSDLALHYTEEPRHYPYRPSVDAFFLSLEKHWPRRDIAVLLTGMGKDGAKGLFALRKAGWKTIAQDEKTSTVYGMPAAAAELKAAGEILPLEEMAGAILRNLRLKG